MPRRRPSTDPERRENQVVAKAVDLAERQIEEGTASSQVLCHYLKLGSEKERLERERLKAENDLLRAKIETLKSGQRIEGLYQEAIEAMRRYSGMDSDSKCEKDVTTR